MKFKELGISKSIQRALEDLNYEEASEIQEKAIPEILKGKDIIGQSQTGTGKTGAFLIPIIEKIDNNDKTVQALILCPTRELALQVSEEAKKFLKYKEGIKAIAIYGGDSMERQIRELKRGPQIVIGTPGRVMDHMRRRTLKLGSTKIVTLDEADEMLNMGFEEDIKTILEDIPSRQTLLFSATMPRKILELTRKYQQDPEHIQIASKELVVSNIEQIYFETQEKAKFQILNTLLLKNTLEYCVVFCNTKRKVEEITKALQQVGFSAECLHGDMRQMQRDQVMKKFKQKEIKLLVATDVAARGIDVENLDCVFNYDLPQEEEYYVHRIGRTGRNGKSGVAYSFVGSRDREKLREIERYAHTKLKISTAPSQKEQEKINNAKKIEQITTALENMKENKENKIIKELCENYPAEKIATALYEMLYPEKEIQIGDAEEQETRGRRRKSEQKTESKHRIYGKDKDMVRVFMNIGKKDKVSTRELIEVISINTAVPKRDIGKIDVLEKYSFVELPKIKANDIISNMNNKKINGRNVNMEFANSRN